jgi:hypothetical protein
MSDERATHRASTFCGEGIDAKPLAALAQMGILWQAQPSHPVLLPYYSPVYHSCSSSFRPSSLVLLQHRTRVLLVYPILRGFPAANVNRLSRHQPPLTDVLHPVRAPSDLSTIPPLVLFLYAPHLDLLYAHDPSTQLSTSHRP